MLFGTKSMVNKTNVPKLKIKSHELDYLKSYKYLGNKIKIKIVMEIY